MKLEIPARENCEYSSDRIGKNDDFMSEDCLGSASALYSQLEKRAFFAKVTIVQINVPS